MKEIKLTVWVVASLLISGVFSAHATEQDRGAVTAIVAANNQIGAFIGYSSGAVAFCTPSRSCTVYEGTPDTAVSVMDVNKHGSSLSVWVGYQNGEAYFCAGNRCKALKL